MRLSGNVASTFCQRLNRNHNFSQCWVSILACSDASLSMVYATQLSSRAVGVHRRPRLCDAPYFCWLHFFYIRKKTFFLFWWWTSDKLFLYFVPKQKKSDLAVCLPNSVRYHLLVYSRQHISHQLCQQTFFSAHIFNKLFFWLLCRQFFFIFFF